MHEKSSVHVCDYLSCISRGFFLLSSSQFRDILFLNVDDQILADVRIVTNGP